MWADSLSCQSFCRPGGRPVWTMVEEMLKYNKAQIWHLCYVIYNRFVSQISVLLDNGNVCLRLQMVYVSVCLNVVSTVEIRQERGSAQTWTFKSCTIVLQLMSKILPRFCVWNEVPLRTKLTMFIFCILMNRCLQWLSIADSEKPYKGYFLVKVVLLV